MDKKLILCRIDKYSLAKEAYKMDIDIFKCEECGTNLTDDSKYRVYDEEFYCEECWNEIMKD
jgi:hypothetical protein